MKIDYQKPILDLAGEPMIEVSEKRRVVAGEVVVTPSEKAVTLGSVAGNALLATFQDEQGLDAKEKVRRFRLAEHTSDQLPVETSVEDVALIKQLIAKAYGPLIVGRAYDLIEPPAPSE